MGGVTLFDVEEISRSPNDSIPSISRPIAGDHLVEFRGLFVASFVRELEGGDLDDLAAQHVRDRDGPRRTGNDYPVLDNQLAGLAWKDVSDEDTVRGIGCDNVLP